MAQQYLNDDDKVYDDDKVAIPVDSHREYAKEDEEGSNRPVAPTTLDVAAIARMTPEEKSEALALAQSIDPGLPLFSYRGFIFCISMISVFVCGGDNGLDGSIMSAINSMTTWQKYFNQAEAAKSTGIIFGVFTVGGVSSFFLSATLPDLIGRRKAMFVPNSILIIGAIITALAINMPMFLVGRFLTGLGTAGATQAAKSYVSELASPKHRGLCVGIYSSTFYIGSLLAAGMSIGTGKLTSDWSWRIPCFVQVLFPLINVSWILFAPESPRWLVSRGRSEEAVRVLARFHSRDNDINSPLVQLELREIQEDINMAGADKRWWDFRVLFRTRANRYRIALAVLLATCNALQGPANTYFSVLLKVAGITSGARQRVLNFANSVTSMSGAIFGAFIIDRVGRRPLFIFSVTSVALFMLAIGGCLSHQHIPSAATAGVTFIFLYGVFGQIGFATINSLYVPEIVGFEMRGKALAFQAIFTQSLSLLNTFVIPTALLALHWKLYIIFGLWDCFLATLVYLFMVETRGIPLEQMDEIFEAPSPKGMARSIVKAKDLAVKAQKDGKA